MNQFITFTICILLIVSTAGFSAEKTSFSLKEVQEFAVKHSTATKNARWDVAIAKKKIWETTAIGLPQVNASLSYQNMLKLPTTLIPAQIFDSDAEPGEFLELQFGTQHNATFDVTATQLIFQGSYIVALQASRVFLQLSKNNLAKSEIEIKAAVTNTYYLILLAQYTRDILDSSLKNLNKNFFEIREMHKAGFLEDTDVDQLQLSITDLQNAIKSIQRQVYITYRLLKFQMGLNLDEEIRLSDSLDSILNRIDAQILLDLPFDYHKHIDFRMVDTAEKSQALMLKKEKSDFLPSISAFMTHSQNAMRNEFNFFKKTEEKWFPSTIIGLSINIPIFSSGMRSARVSQAKLELKKIKQSKKQLISGLQLDLQRARSDFTNAREKSANTEKNVELAKRIYDKTLIKYREGISSSLELTQTHNQYLTTQTNHVKAVIELLTAKTKLDKALSRL